MPVQINEMVIRANIIAPGDVQKKEVKDAAAGDINKEEIIKECAALVLEIIKNKNER